MSKFITSLLLAFTLGCVTPNIPHGDDPAPVPADATKKSAAMWVVTVDDYRDRDAERSAVLEQLARLGPPHRAREYDVANPEWKKYQSQVDAAGGPPCAFFLDMKSHKQVGKPMKLPEKYEDLKSAIDKYTVKP